MDTNYEFTATLEKRLQDVPRSDELYEIKKVVRELKLGLNMAQDRSNGLGFGSQLRSGKINVVASRLCGSKGLIGIHGCG